MARLKTGTNDAHRFLEKSSCFKRLFASDYQVVEYSKLLSYFYGYFQGMESILFADLPAHYRSVLAYRAKTHLLSEDLKAFAIDESGLPVCHDLPEMQSLAQKLGCLYVLEGSMLGGQVIARHLKGHFGEGLPATALNFYQCYGANLMQEWQGFASFMNRYFETASEEDCVAAIHAANATFMALQTWVDKQAAAETV